jgi:hypothetical protein
MTSRPLTSSAQRIFLVNMKHRKKKRDAGERGKPRDEYLAVQN